MPASQSLAEVQAELKADVFITAIEQTSQCASVHLALF